MVIFLSYWLVHENKTQLLKKPTYIEFIFMWSIFCSTYKAITNKTAVIIILHKTLGRSAIEHPLMSPMLTRLHTYTRNFKTTFVLCGLEHRWNIFELIKPFIKKCQTRKTTIFQQGYSNFELIFFKEFVKFGKRFWITFRQFYYLPFY